MGNIQDDASNDPAATWKQAAAEAAASEVREDMLIGLGSGSTAEFFLHALASRVRQGLRVTGVATSERTSQIAGVIGIPLRSLDDAPMLDMSVDGADEVVRPELSLIKGRGGALLREKLVAAVSQRRIIIVDESKLVAALGTHVPLPVEVVPFGWIHTMRRLAALGWRVERREIAATDATSAPYVTDSGNYLLDCHTGPLADVAATARYIKSLVGVVEHGLFVGMTERVIVAGSGGLRTYDHTR